MYKCNGTLISIVQFCWYHLKYTFLELLFSQTRDGLFYLFAFTMKVNWNIPENGHEIGYPRIYIYSIALIKTGLLQ